MCVIYSILCLVICLIVVIWAVTAPPGQLGMLVWPTCCVLPVLQVVICLIIRLTICFMIKTLCCW